MISEIYKKEITQFRRDGRVITVILILLGLGVAAAFSGWNSVQTMERERRAAVAVDEEVWNNQGEKNAHTAAHFSRYAFQPTSSLAVFDPGITDYVGSAIWMEAHYRDPAKLRPIEDAVEIQRFAELSPAWILQSFAPLLIVLLVFASIAGERENGTLRHVMSSGVKPASVLWGKGLAAFAVLAVLAPIVVLAVLVSAFSENVTRLPDTGLRLTGMTVGYALYLAAFTLFAIGISAQAARAKTALVVLLGFWAISAVFAPRLASDVGASLSPAPQPAEFSARLSSESSEPFWGGSDEAAQRRDSVRDGLLAEYNVDKIEDLPINYDGYLLQASEEYANDVFDRLYNELYSTYERQQSIARTFAVISPTIAVQNISRALAGSDLYAHRHFADQTELFRRDFVRLLNEEMINNGGQDGYGYVSGNDFWESNPDFEYSPPRISDVTGRIWTDIIVLLAWFAVGVMFAAGGVHRSFVQEARA